jgi:competence protein ComEA
VPELLRPTPPPTWRDRVQLVVNAARAAPAVSAVAAGAVLVVACMGFLLVRKSTPAPEIQLPRAQAAPAPAATATSADVIVHVAGAVVRPGLVKIAPGARMADALAAAGGPRPDADLDQVNLAAKVGDGDRVYVPRRGEAPPPTGGVGASSNGSSSAKTGPVDLNSAGPDELDGLPGVGPATAKAIVEYRTRHGRFKTIDDLLAVPGIGPAKLATLKPLVRV